MTHNTAHTLQKISLYVHFHTATKEHIVLWYACSMLHDNLHPAATLAAIRMCR